MEAGDPPENVVDVPATPLSELTAMVSEEQELLVPLWSVTEYVEVPPDQLIVTFTVADWPKSITVGERARVGTPRGGLTVTMAGAEATDTDALSVTCSLKLQTPRIERAPVDTLGEEELEQLNEPPRELKVLAPGACSSHWHV